MQVALNGCIAQLARACGSYPQCHRFKSSYSHHPARWSRGLRHRPFTAVTRVRIPSGSPKQHLPFMGGCCFFACKKDGMRTRRARRNSPKPALGFWDCEVLSTAKCFGYRSQRSKHCRRRVSRPGHQKSHSRKWMGFLLFHSSLFTLHFSPTNENGIFGK